MNRLLGITALALLPGLAHASAERFPPLFDREAGTITPEAREAVAKTVEGCSYSMMSRIGPRPGEVKRCNDRIAELVSLGTPGAYAAIAAIDDPETNGGARHRLYDVVARTGDLRFLEPLVKALEREDQAGLGNPRHYEREEIVAALTRLTYAEMKGTPAIQWREWLTAHQGKTRPELLAERTAEAEQQLASEDVEAQLTAVRFLTQHKQTARARRALEALSARTDLSRNQERSIKNMLAILPSDSVPSQKQAKGPDVPRS